MNAASQNPDRRIAVNRKALHEYFVLDRFEAGIELRGTEVKSIRAGHASLAGSYAQILDGEAFLHQLTIPGYEHGNRFNHEPTRRRRLLLHKKEIVRLQIQTDQKGHAIVPLSLYIRKGIVKLEIALCKGKLQRDKRETLKRKTAEREASRAMASRTRR